MNDETAVEMRVYGARGLYTINGMTFPVIIKATRKAYGRTDAQITPVNGYGEKWVDLNSLTEKED